MRRSTILAVVAAIVLLGAGFVFYRKIWAERTEIAFKARLKQVALALHQYHDTYASFPPAYVLGPDQKPWHSWRVLLLPQLGRDDLYRQYRLDEPWDGPSNSKLLDQMPEEYGSPFGVHVDGRTTQLLAPVGAETAWPDQYSTRLGDIKDGSSNTIHLLEVVDSDVSWSEPRDLSYEDAVHWTEHPPGRLPVDVAGRAVMADGAVRKLARSIGREPLKSERLLQRLLTAYSGGPFPRGNWPVPPLLEMDFGPVRKSSELTLLSVEGGVSTVQLGAVNRLWCVTTQLAWDELRRILNTDAVKVDSGPEWVAELNGPRFPAAALASECFLAVASQGTTAAGTIRQALSQKLPGFVAEIPQIGPNEWLLFSALRKELPFQTEYESLVDGLEFQSEGRTTRVQAFGIEQFTGIGQRDEAIHRQFRVADYVTDEDFVLVLGANSEIGDEIIFAKTQPSSDFGATIRNAALRAEMRDQRPQLEPSESFACPVLRVNVLREFEELENCSVRPTLPGQVDSTIRSALQVIRFRIDRRGAKLESYFEASVSEDEAVWTPPAPPKPRKFILDRSFLLLLRQKGSQQPYFAAWIANEELMIPSP